MKRIGKGVYEIPGGVYYRAVERRIASPAHVIFRLTGVEKVTFDNASSLRGSPEDLRELGMRLIEAAAHAEAAEQYGSALDDGLAECERTAREP